MNKTYISAYAASNVGKRRQNNEDNYFLSEHYVNSNNEASAEVEKTDSIIISVCDGMGGEAAGEVASQIAVEAVNKCYSDLLKNNLSDTAIERYVARSNDLICEEITQRKKRMGTTYTLLGIKDGVVTASNIGDSRIYRYSDGVLKQISKDHTEAQSMVDSGIITAEQSMKIPEKHRLTQHLGIYSYEMVIEPYNVRFESKAGDRYLLCSDGLTDMLTDFEINEIFRKCLSLKQTVEELISKALQNGGKDNVTVAVCEIKDEDTTERVDNTCFAQDQAASTSDSKQRIINAFGIDDISKTPDIVISKSEQQPQPASKKKEAGLLKRIIICIVIIALLIGGFFVGKAYQKKKSESVSTTQTNKSIRAQIPIFNQQEL